MTEKIDPIDYILTFEVKDDEDPTKKHGYTAEFEALHKLCGEMKALKLRVEELEKR